MIIPLILLGGLLIITIRASGQVYTDKRAHIKKYECKGGKYRGICCTVDEWRKIAIKESKGNDWKLETLARYGTDSEVFGALYLMGIEI